MNFLYIPSSDQLGFARKVAELIPAPHTLVLKNSATNSLLEINNTIRQAAATKQLQIHGLIVSDISILQQLLHRQFQISLIKKDEASIKPYQGCLFHHTVVLTNGTSYQIPVIIIPSPEHLSYSEQSRWLFKRWISKLWDTTWFSMPKLNWTLLDIPNDNSPLGDRDRGEVLKKLSSPECVLIAVDIETALPELPIELHKTTSVSGIKTSGIWYEGYARTESNAKSKTRLALLVPIITCIGYCAIFKAKDGSLSSHTYVLPMRTMNDIHWMRAFNKTEAPKVMHNGRYDSTYLLRYNAPLHNWVYDTLGMMHSWMVELPRSLDFTTALVIRNSMYWKDEAKHDVYGYNAKDCHATAWACLALLVEMPQWAKDNYLSNFKMVFPAICCGLEGFRQDPAELYRLSMYYTEEIEKDRAWWDKVVCKNFNIGSPAQVKTLFTDVLGTGIQDTGAGTLKGIQHKHPFWRLMVDRLISSREKRKADSTYMNIIPFAGRVLYELDPFGTVTCRFASKESSFWCGTQIQNIPMYAKSMFVPDRGYVLNAIDNAQSESRTTAYTTGDERLIDAVENAKDFHTRNASMFFGIPEAELWRLKASADKAEQKLYDIYRNIIGKRINHGANYNMAEFVLIETMTPTRIITAKHTLKLPLRYTLKEVATYLLACFDRAYPLIRSQKPGGYHHALIKEIAQTSKLLNPDGWVRYTFNRPGIYDADTDTVTLTKKVELNEVVAHKPQSWSVRIINKAFFAAWYKYQIQESKCRMKAQIHDEILYQTLEEHTDEVTAGISALMRRPEPILHGPCKGQTLVIPNDPKTRASNWKKLKG